MPPFGLFGCTRDVAPGMAHLAIFGRRPNEVRE
jgi:hypothetical protein